MLYKKMLKAISAVLTASIMLASAPAIFAENNVVSGATTALQSEINSNVSQSGNDDAGAGSGGASISAPQPVSVNISANYFLQSDNTYIVEFSSLDVLDNLKDFNFTITLTNAELSSPAFGDALKTGSYKIETVGNNSANFKNGSLETLLSGKLVLCSIKTNVLPTLQNLSFTDFSAVDKDGNTVTFSPSLTVDEGPVVPELSEKEQSVYDAIIALPAITNLSFYDDNSLISVEELKETVTNAANAYSALTSSQKANVEEVLTYNMKSSEILTTLPPVVDAMCNVYDIFILSAKLKGVDDNDIVNHKFIIDVYESIKNTISADNLPNPSNVYTEYEAALSLITSSSSIITSKLAGMSYSDKIDNVAKQLEVAKPFTTDKYYNEYLSCLLSYATSLYDDMEENCIDKYKEYMLQDLNTKISSIKAAQNNIASLPDFEIGKVMRARNYSITIDRQTSAEDDANIEIYVYAEDDPDKVIDSKTSTFKASAKTLEVKMTALKNTYPANNKKITVIIKYTLGGITYNLGSKSVVCYKEMVNPTSSVSRPATNPGDTKTDEPSNPSGTIFPEVNDNDDTQKPSTPTENKLFNDIDKYLWASEAIEGLYYAGIINGMEEGIFNPSGNVTREQFCKMVVQLFNVLDYEALNSFSDVDPNAWYTPYINSSIKSGYVQGQSDNYFGVGESIMRQDMATILYRALGSQGKATALSFTDNDKIADYAKEAIAEFVGLDIINGYEDGSFNPRGTATRAEAAKVIWGVYKLIHK